MNEEQPDVRDVGGQPQHAGTSGLDPAAVLEQEAAARARSRRLINIGLGLLALGTLMLVVAAIGFASR